MNDPLHPSKLGEWATCPKRAWYGLDRRSVRDAETMATWVGTAAHAIALEQPMPEAPAGYAAYDSVTPNIETARMQANYIAEHFNAELDARGLGIVESELAVMSSTITGVLDVLLQRDTTRARIIGDLKTGRMLPASVWLQLGAYVKAYREWDPDAEPIESVMLFHVPRMPLHERSLVLVEERPAAACALAAERLIGEISRWLDAATFDTVPATPGLLACAGCPISVDACAVKVNTKGTPR